MGRIGTPALPRQRRATARHMADRSPTARFKARGQGGPLCFTGPPPRRLPLTLDAFKGAHSAAPMGNLKPPRGRAIDEILVLFASGLGPRTCARIEAPVGAVRHELFPMASGSVE